ncbi:MAG: hypothetical protein V9H69_19395 [Anaerolineae bacterium]
MQRCGWWAEERDAADLRWLAAGLALHSALDVLTHHDDGPLLLFPFDWRRRWCSPVSYWDQAHHAAPFTVFRIRAGSAAAALLARKGVRAMANSQRMRRLTERAGIIGLTVVLLLPLVPLVIWAFSQRWLFPVPSADRMGPARWRYILDPNTRRPGCPGRAAWRWRWPSLRCRWWWPCRRRACWAYTRFAARRW